MVEKVRVPNRAVLARALNNEAEAIKAFEAVSRQGAVDFPEMGGDIENLSVRVDALESEAKHLIFYSESEDVTDELRAFIEPYRYRLRDEFGGVRGTVPPLKVYGLGRKYKLSEKLLFDADFCGLSLNDFLFEATEGAAAWSTPDGDCMLQFGSDNSTFLLTNTSIKGVGFICNRQTSAINLEYTNGAVIQDCYADAFTAFGIRAWKRNRALAIRGGRYQEWGNASVVGKTLSNRTARGIWIESSDGTMSDVVIPICRVGIYFNNIRNFTVDNHCHPWMGDLLDEAERYEAYTMQIGSSVDEDPDYDDSLLPSGISCVGVEFDNGPVKINSFSHQFVGCKWVLSADRANIPALILESTSPNERATGLSLLGNRISRTHSADWLSFVDGPGGSWSADKKYTAIGNMQGDVRLLPNKVGAIHMRGLGDNWDADGGSRTGYDQILFSNHLEPLDVAGRMGSIAIHSDRASDGDGVVHTQWGTSGSSPAFVGAASESTEIGVFGGLPPAGRVLARMQGTGDNGTDFSNNGGAVEVVAAAQWTPTSTPTKLRVKVTKSGETTWSDAFEVTDEGNVFPENDRTQNLGGLAHEWNEVYARRALFDDVTLRRGPTSVLPPTGAMALRFDSDGGLEAVGAGGSVFNYRSEQYLSVDFPLVSSGGTYLIPNKQKATHVRNASTVAALTIELPYLPDEAIEYSVTCVNGITALTVQLNTTEIDPGTGLPYTTGHSIAYAPTTLAAGGRVAWRFRAFSKIWYPA